eukprot:TRINITY_DN774429_c0_g1_i1.p1 TRINITY_DN774429_c0_g1~~TRINITY_DN774429_c0_g1_i1.p1  ORF type:complete len:248 (+),score=80.40 TRINITY_DN774429_c0_g1_i1:215-958(+)
MYSGKKALIVIAHHEKKSFNFALKDRAVETLEGLGMEVMISDLHDMDWDPISDERNFKDRQDQEFLKQALEEEHAVKTKSFSDDIAAEQEKVDKADFLLFIFPLWWFSTPAIMKGWFDRVFARTFAYGGRHEDGSMKHFEDGGFRGKKAMCAVTTGGPEVMYSGVAGDIHKEVLYHITHGTFFFSGLTPLKSFVGYSVAHLPENQRKLILDDFATYITEWDQMDSMPVRNFKGSAFDEMIKAMAPKL